MAKINGLNIFVIQEDLSYGVSVTEHTVEEGVAISDHVKRNAITLSLTGEIVGGDATNTLAQLRKLHHGGSLCEYAGRVSLSNCLITELSTTQTHKVWGGYEFSMTLKEIRTAKTAYKEPAKPKKDAKPTNLGTQQKKPKSDSPNVYHTVKKGDTVWGLVCGPNAPYKSLKRTENYKTSRNVSLTPVAKACNWVMAMNPNAFSRKGDFRTLKVGYKLNMGTRAK